MLERIAKDPQAFILQQGWAGVSFDPERGLVELRSLYEHLQARILEMEIFREVEQDEQVIDRIAAAQREELEREELEREIAGLEAEAERAAEEARELAGEVPF